MAEDMVINEILTLKDTESASFSLAPSLCLVCFSLYGINIFQEESRTSFTMLNSLKKIFWNPGRESNQRPREWESDKLST